jgi:tRNA-modifying protein YgfZ
MTEGYEALRHGAACLDLSERGRIAARGRDRVRLLHNVTSNDVKKLQPGSGVYAFLLTPQGRIQGDLDLLSFADHFLIGTEPDLREKVQQLILKYRVADQVELEDITESTKEIGLEGPRAAEVLASMGIPVPGEPYTHLPWGDWIVANLSVTGQPGFRIIGAGASMPPFLAAGAKPATDSEIRQVRIENGRPRFGEDIRETSLPQETQQMRAVSFQKGCYIGQEIVERIRAQGHVNKKLVRLRIDSQTAPPAGSKLTADGKEAGEITSAVYSPASHSIAALAIVRVPHSEPGSVLETGGARAQVLGN